METRTSPDRVREIVSRRGFSVLAPDGTRATLLGYRADGSAVAEVWNPFASSADEDVYSHLTFPPEYVGMVAA